jgi:hypothetical protein
MTSFRRFAASGPVTATKRRIVARAVTARATLMKTDSVGDKENRPKDRRGKSNRAPPEDATDSREFISLYSPTSAYRLRLVTPRRRSIR